jgi:flagellar biosynthesis chaperone FliJ
MTAKEKAKLIRQAGKLYTLGVTVENRREKLRRLVEKKVPYDSSQMKAAISEFQTADEEWKQLEQEHLKYRQSLGVEDKNSQW